MNPIAAPLIRRQIKRIGSGDAFDDGSFVVGGAVENLSIEDWLHRWGDSPSMGKQLDRMASHAQGEGVAHMALAQGGKLAKMGGDEYIAWFKRLQENREVWNIPQEEVSIMRDSQEYLASGVQELMMILDKPISGEPDAQDLLKRVVGATNPLKADDDTIRAKMRDELDLKKRAEFPFIRNIIHCPKREEQELELGPMSDETVRIFVKAARQYNAFRNN
jgi:nucleoside diphosphate kinase